jgi:hypothetical protein
VIDAELGRKIHRSPQLRSRENWNQLIPELTPNQIQLVVKTKKKLV